MPTKDGERRRVTGGGVSSAPSWLILSLALAVSLAVIGPNLSDAETGGNPVAGKATYDKLCAACHGRQGEGLGNMPSFRNRSHMESRTDHDLFEKISRGGQGTGMPPFATQLAEQDRWNVIAYIRTLSSSQ